MVLCAPNAKVQNQNFRECIRPRRYSVQKECVRLKFECIRPKFECIRPEIRMYLARTPSPSKIRISKASQVAGCAFKAGSRLDPTILGRPLAEQYTILHIFLQKHVLGILFLFVLSIVFLKKNAFGRECIRMYSARFECIRPDSNAFGQIRMYSAGQIRSFFRCG